MPILTRLFIKTALLYLVAALLAGVLLLARPALSLPDQIVALTPVYFHLLMVGWVTQLVFGVAHWMFPKYSQARPRGSERLGWATYFMLSAGLILRAVGEPLAALQVGAFFGWLVAASAVLQLLAGWAFVANTWSRVRERA